MTVQVTWRAQGTQEMAVLVRVQEEKWGPTSKRAAPEKWPEEIANPGVTELLRRRNPL